MNLKPIENLLLARWRYADVWLIPNFDGWRVYNEANEVYLGVGYPALYWDPQHKTAYVSPEAALADLARAQMSHPRSVAWDRKKKQSLEGAISVEALVEAQVQKWQKTTEIKPEISDTITSKPLPEHSPSSQSASIFFTRITLRTLCVQLLVLVQKRLRSLELFLIGAN